MAPTVKFEVKGQQPRTHFIATQLDDIATRSRHWYHRLATLGLTNIGLAALGTLGVLWAAAVFVKNVMFTTPEQAAAINANLSSMNITTMMNGFVMIGGAVLLVRYLAGRLRAWMFPLVVFALGDGQQIPGAFELGNLSSLG